MLNQDLLDFVTQYQYRQNVENLFLALNYSYDDIGKYVDKTWIPKTIYHVKQKYDLGIQEGYYEKKNIFISHGITKCIYKDGIIQERNLYHNLLHGIFKEYNKEENLKKECYYSYGKLHGSYKKYDNDGKLENECYYSCGKLHGLNRSYDKGNLCSEYNYDHGKKHGIFREWDFSGKRTTEMKWKDDQLVSVCNFYQWLSE